MEDITQLEKNILRGDLDQAVEQLISFPFKRIAEIILPMAFGHDSMAFYGLAAKLIAKYPSAESSYFAAELLTTALSHLHGAYPLALHHARQAIAHAPNDLTYQEFLLLFHQIPEPLIDQEEAQAIAHRLLAADPDHQTAKRVVDG